MRTFHRSLIVVGLLALGYGLGSSGVLAPTALRAQKDQKEEDEGLRKETQEKIKDAHAALVRAMAALQEDQLYTPVMKGVNAFAVLSGGANVKQDLETGRGVDPETFAALYADQATDEIGEHLKKDDQGRMTYKNKVVRMYPISRLKKMFAERAKLVGEADEE